MKYDNTQLMILNGHAQTMTDKYKPALDNQLVVIIIIMNNNENNPL